MRSSLLFQSALAITSSIIIVVSLHFAVVFFYAIDTESTHTHSHRICMRFLLCPSTSISAFDCCYSNVVIAFCFIRNFAQWENQFFFSLFVFFIIIRFGFSLPCDTQYLRFLSSFVCYSFIFLFCPTTAFLSHLH